MTEHKKKANVLVIHIRRNKDNKKNNYINDNEVNDYLEKLKKTFPSTSIKVVKIDEDKKLKNKTNKESILFYVTFNNEKDYITFDSSNDYPIGLAELENVLLNQIFKGFSPEIINLVNTLDKERWPQIVYHADISFKPFDEMILENV